LLTATQCSASREFRSHNTLSRRLIQDRQHSHSLRSATTTLCQPSTTTTSAKRAYGPITIAIRARFEHDTSTTRARHATTRYEVFRALAYEIDSSTPRKSVVGVSCMLIDSSMHTTFTLYLYRPTLHRVCKYARNCLYKRN